MPILTTSVKLVGGDAADRRRSGPASAKAQEPVERRMHLRDDVLAVDADVGVGGRAERDVQDGAVLRHVDRLAGEHRIAQRLDLGALGEREQKRHRLRDDAVLGIVERQIAERRPRSARSGRDRRRRDREDADCRAPRDAREAPRARRRRQASCRPARVHGRLARERSRSAPSRRSRWRPSASPRSRRRR